MNAKQHIAQLVEQALAAAFPEAQGLPAAAEIEGFLEVPPDRAMGDFAFPCFRLSKALRKGPPMIAQAVLSALCAEIPSAASVAPPTVPSAVRPFARWNHVTASYVLCPNTPSTLPA